MNNLEDSPGVLAAVAVVENARQQGLLLHDMMDSDEFPGAIPLLAEQGVCTTAEPRYPRDFWEFRKEQPTERELAQLEANARLALGAIEPFEQAQRAGRLGAKLIEVFGAVRTFHMEELYLADTKIDNAGELVEGTATAEWTTFVVGDIEERELLRGVFHAWARTGEIDKIHEIRTDTKDGQHTISLSNMNEYTTRVMESAVARIVATDDKTQTGTTLPKDRLPASRWKAENETFLEVIDERMCKVNDAYVSMFDTATATYKDGVPHTSLQEEMRRKPEALGSTPAAVFEGLRKGFNSVRRAAFGSGQFNQEQNPNKAWRLLIEEGVDIKRDPMGLGQDGPPRARSLSASERLRKKTSAIVASKKKRPIKALVKGITVLVGAGLEVIADVSTEVVPWAKSGGVRLWQDWRAWRQQQGAAVEAGVRIDEAVARIRQQRERDE